MKEILNILVTKDFNESKLQSTMKYVLETYDDDQLEHLLMTGLKITNNLVLYYYPNVGFRCINENGTDYICGVIDRALNKNNLKFNI